MPSASTCDVRASLDHPLRFFTHRNDVRHGFPRLGSLTNWSEDRKTSNLGATDGGSGRLHL